jgi:crooked neck
MAWWHDSGDRVLDVDYKNQTIWLKYAEMEMRHKFVNHARNVWDRAVTLLPRIDQFWYKYTYMEEMLGNIAQARYAQTCDFGSRGGWADVRGGCVAFGRCRQIFERWMQWEPDDNGWNAYVKFEMRQQETQRARAVFERYVQCHPTQRAFLKFARYVRKSWPPGLGTSLVQVQPWSKGTT